MSLLYKIKKAGELLNPPADMVTRRTLPSLLREDEGESHASAPSSGRRNSYQSHVF